MTVLRKALGVLGLGVSYITGVGGMMGFAMSFDSADPDPALKYIIRPLCVAVPASILVGSVYLVFS